MAVIDFFDRGWRLNPTGAAYTQGERAYTYNEVGALSCRIANRILTLGLPKEAKGAVWSGNDVTAWTCTLGLWRANKVWIPVNPRSSAEENRYVIDTFDCEILFFQNAYAPVVDSLRGALTKVKHWVCIDADLPWAPSLDSWLADASAIKQEEDVIRQIQSSQAPSLLKQPPAEWSASFS